MPVDVPAYNSKIAALLEHALVNELGPGAPRESVRPLLESLGPGDLSPGQALVDREMALACMAGLWLRNDFLDQSHTISQSLERAEGSYWHAIVHRREPDYTNAKYWCRQVGRHPIHEPLQAAAAQLASADGLLQADFLTRQAAWNSSAFVDLCELAASGSPPLQRLCRNIQLHEWELLFDFCLRGISG